MDPRKQITKGMTVYTRDGEKLGKVAVADDTGLFVEKGLFFPKEYGFQYDDVEDVRADGVHLRVNKDAIVRQESSRDPGAPRHNPGPASDDGARTATSTAGTTTGGPQATTPASGEPGGVAKQATPPTGRAEGLYIPMVGEGIAPMLVEDEVIVRESPPASEERRASPQRSPDAASGGNRPDSPPDVASTPDRKDPRHG
jgi:hypothetical protein